MKRLPLIQADTIQIMILSKEDIHVPIQEGLKLKKIHFKKKKKKKLKKKKLKKMNPKIQIVIMKMKMIMIQVIKIFIQIKIILKITQKINQFYLIEIQIIKKQKK